MPTVIKAAAVLDVDKDRVIPDGFVLVAGGKIQSWGNRVDLPTLSPETAVLSFPQQTPHTGSDQQPRPPVRTIGGPAFLSEAIR